MRRQTVCATLLLLVGLAVCARADSSDGIDFRTSPLYDGEHYCGSDYYARNVNPYPVYLTVRVVGTNVYDGLIASYTPLLLQPNEEGYLGRVTQADRSLEAEWTLQYQVSDATNQ
ncbi:MAG: hypothetical protein AB1758_34600 [Candidatus Eremiobacterota bacterium]